MHKTVAVVSLLALACAAFVVHDIATLRSQMVKDLTAHADIVGNNSTAALIFGDDGETTLREEIEEAIDEAEESPQLAGDLSPHERQMLRNLLHFGDQTAGDVCVTRGDIIAVPSNIGFDDLVRAFAEAGHSRLPVYGDSLDEVVGMIHIKDVFVAHQQPDHDRSIATLLRVTEGNMAAAAGIAGLDRSNFRKVVVKAGVDFREFLPRRLQK